MEFEWDEWKNQENLYKHGLSFDEAVEAFRRMVVTTEDRRFDYGERRLITIGSIRTMKIIVIVHTQRDNRIRVISARPAIKKEQRLYEQAVRKADHG